MSMEKTCLLDTISHLSAKLSPTVLVVQPDKNTCKQDRSVLDGMTDTEPNSSYERRAPTSSASWPRELNCRFYFGHDQADANSSKN